MYISISTKEVPSLLILPSFSHQSDFEPDETDEPTIHSIHSRSPHQLKALAPRPAKD